MWGGSARLAQLVGGADREDSPLLAANIKSITDKEGSVNTFGRAISTAGRAGL